jgi:hypothetical protein
VNRTGANHHDQPVVAPIEDVAHRAAHPTDHRRARTRQGEIIEQNGRREQGPDAGDAEVAGARRIGIGVANNGFHARQRR